MAQRNIEVIAGFRFYRLDGELFPVLEGAKGASVPPPDPGLVDKQNQLLQMQIDNANKSSALEPLLLSEAGIKYNPSTKSYEYADPAAAKQRQDLQNQYTSAQLDSLQRSKALEPVMMEQMGLKYDPVTKTYQQLNPELAANKREIEKLQTERSLKALKGELPVSETLKKELERGQLQLDEELNRQMGPGYKNSSAGAMRQREYDTMATQLKEGEQRDMLTTAEALSMNRGQFNQQQAQGYAAPRAATNNAYSFSASDPMGRQAAFENPFAAKARMLSPAQASLDSARNQDNFTRQMRFDKSKALQEDWGNYIGAGIGLGGQLASAAMLMPSDPAVKKDVSDVSDAEMLAAVTRIPVKRWKYKDDPEGREHLGGMADTMPEVVSDGKLVDVISYLGMLTGGIRELSRKLEEREEMSPAMALAY